MPVQSPSSDPNANVLIDMKLTFAKIYFSEYFTNAMKNHITIHRQMTLSQGFLKTNAQKDDRESYK